MHLLKPLEGTLPGVSPKVTRGPCPLCWGTPRAGSRCMGAGRAVWGILVPSRISVFLECKTSLKIKAKASK